MGGGRTMPDDFLSWFEAWPHAHKILVAGNHDFVAEQDAADFRRRLSTISRTTYMCDSGATIAGVRFWGSPVTPWFYDWAFNRHRGPEIAQHWAKMPADTQVLVTHAPPQGVLDANGNGEAQGCWDLLQRTADLPDLRLHVFGHIHAWGGRTVEEGVRRCLNAAVCDDQYRVVREPVVIEL